ncbi:hypothetical protein N7451_011232 [Penicillium sp. IBT 35674x]|nr:hypothetical protein N7451_011232 [Penicillium sp. IBT 35674x]
MQNARKISMVDLIQLLCLFPLRSSSASRAPIIPQSHIFLGKVLNKHNERRINGKTPAFRTLRFSLTMCNYQLRLMRRGFYPAFYSFVTNASISAPYIFANFGADNDYNDLVKNIVSLAGKIAVLKSADASSYLRSLHLEMSREVQIMPRTEAFSGCGHVPRSSERRAHQWID